MKKKNIFLVDTHFQLIAACICIKKLYNNEIEHLNIIYLNDQKKRFHQINREFWFSGLSNSKLLKWESSLGFDFYAQVISEKPDRLVFSQEGNPVYRAIAKTLKDRMQTEIFLGPDGCKSYFIFNKNHEFLSNLKEGLIDFKVLLESRIPLSSYSFPQNYKHGYHKYVDTYLVPYPQIFAELHNISIEKTAKLPFLDDSVFEFLKVNLSWAFNQELKINSVLWVASPYKNDVFFSLESEILAELSKQGEALYIKPHPRDFGRYEELKYKIHNIEIINSDAPVEFIIRKLSNCLIASLWSTGMIFPLGQNNEFVYYFDVFKPYNKISRQISFKGFPHTKMSYI